MKNQISIFGPRYNGGFCCCDSLLGGVRETYSSRLDD